MVTAPGSRHMCKAIRVLPSGLSYKQAPLRPTIGTQSGLYILVSRHTQGSHIRDLRSDVSYKQGSLRPSLGTQSRTYPHTPLPVQNRLLGADHNNKEIE